MTLGLNIKFWRKHFTNWIFVLEIITINNTHKYIIMLTPTPPSKHSIILK